MAANVLIKQLLTPPEPKRRRIGIRNSDDTD